MNLQENIQDWDVVEIDGSIGRDIEMKLFVTRLHTIKNEEVDIPNSTVLIRNNKAL